MIHEDSNSIDTFLLISLQEFASRAVVRTSLRAQAVDFHTLRNHDGKGVIEILIDLNDKTFRIDNRNSNIKSYTNNSVDIRRC